MKTDQTLVKPINKPKFGIGDYVAFECDSYAEDSIGVGTVSGMRYDDMGTPDERITYVVMYWDGEEDGYDQRELYDSQIAPVDSQLYLTYLNLRTQLATANTELSRAIHETK